jgi:deoxyribonuclease-4
MQEKKCLIGAHTSTAGGLFKALNEGAAIGATTVQIFTSNQRQWKGRQLQAEEVALFHKTKEETGVSKIMSHASYLLNLGSPDDASLFKSQEALREEIVRCKTLGISFLNFHPGSALKAPREACLERIAESMRGMQDLLEGSELKLLLETTAGQGSNVGSTFEEIGYLVAETKGIIPVGVCVDTCHIFAAGYDIRTAAGWEQTLDHFDRCVGLAYLDAFHLNDSLQPHNSRKDRHAPLGQGEIGAESFQYLMQSPKVAAIPKYLETPGGPELWKKEIVWLREQV